MGLFISQVGSPITQESYYCNFCLQIAVAPITDNPKQIKKENTVWSRTDTLGITTALLISTGSKTFKPASWKGKATSL